MSRRVANCFAESRGSDNADESPKGLKPVVNLDQALSSCHTQEAFGCALGSLKLALVGGFSGTAVAQSLLRAARAANIRCSTFDVASAYGKNRVLQALSWRLRDKKPLNFNQFCASVVMRCTDECPRVLVTTGSAPLTAATLDRLRSQGVVCMNYSTDDPWSPTMRAKIPFSFAASRNRTAISGVGSKACTVASR